MADQKVNIKVTAQGAKQAKSELSGVTGAISKMGKAVGIASAAYFGAKGLINSFSSVIELAGIQEQAEKQLETALGRTSTALLNQASALQKVTIFGDEATIQQQAFLASIGFTEEKIMSIIPVAMDLASATGMTLESAVRNTAKTFSGLAGELGELVPQLRDLTAEEMKAGDAVKVMAELFEGQATAQANTMAGALDQAGNAAGDLAEAIGEKLSPLVKVLATDFAKTAEGLTNFINPETISRQDQLNELLDQYFNIQSTGSGVLKDNATTVEDIFANLSTIDPFAIGLNNEQIDTATESLRTQIDVFNDLLFAKKEDLALKESDIPLTAKIEQVEVNSLVTQIEARNKLINLKKEQVRQDLKGAALSGQTAKESMKSVVRAETMEAVSGYIAEAFKSFPFPINLILAAGAGGAVASVMDAQLAKFADGGIVQGDPSRGDSVPAMLTAGEVILNQAQQDNLVGNMGGITLNITAPLVDEHILDTILPAIEKAQRLNLA